MNPETEQACSMNTTDSLAAIHPTGPCSQTSENDFAPPETPPSVPIRITRYRSAASTSAVPTAPLSQDETETSSMSQSICWHFAHIVGEVLAGSRTIKQISGLLCPTDLKKLAQIRHIACANRIHLAGVRGQNISSHIIEGCANYRWRPHKERPHILLAIAFHLTKQENGWHCVSLQPILPNIFRTHLSNGQ